MIPLLVVLFGVYVALVTLQMRRALSTATPEARLREARRLLFLVSVGVPLAVGFVLVAL